MGSSRILYLPYLLIITVAPMLISDLHGQGKENRGNKSLISERPGADDDQFYDFTLGFTSNYVFRGTNMHRDRADQQGKPHTSTRGAPAFQMNLRVYDTALKRKKRNWFLELWYSAAVDTAARDDQDADKRYQTAAGDPVDRLAASVLDDIQGGLPLGSSFTFPPSLSSLPDVPDFRKEDNGLKRRDEIRLRYESFEDSGWLNSRLGVVFYVFPNLPETSPGQNIELIFIARPGKRWRDDLIPDFKWAGGFGVEVYHNVGFSAKYTYVNVNYEWDSWKLHDGSFMPAEKKRTEWGLGYEAKLGVGYQDQRGVRGIRDITGTFTLKAGTWDSHLSLRFGVTVRPQFAFHDGDPVVDKNFAAWLEGGSTARDGLRPDPSLANGFANNLVNEAITDFLRTNFSPFAPRYIPRKKIPRALAWVNFSWTGRIRKPDLE